MSALRCGLLGVAAAALFHVSAPGSLAATNVDPNNSFAWGANVGWLNWAADLNNGVLYGRPLSGYIYASNVGWIHMGDGTPNNGVAYSNASATDYGVNADAFSDPDFILLSGYAWGANIGWVNFSVASQAGEENRPRIERATGRLLGYAWAANAGWLPLNASPDASVIFELDAAVAPGAWGQYR